MEFFEDLIDKDPTEAYPRAVAESGRFVRWSGDPVADEWEKQVAAGKVPDVLAAFDGADRARLEKFLKRKSPSAESAEPELESEFKDSYE